MSTREWVRGLINSRGPDYAIEELVRKVIDDQEHENALFASRFFERVKELGKDNEPTGRKYLRKVTAHFISNSIDMADCGDSEPQEFLYNDDDGELYPVTIGDMARCEMDEHSVVYGHSDIIANGKVVGTVTFTDH